MNSQKKFQLLLVFLCLSTFSWGQVGVTTLGTGAGQNNTDNYTTYIGYNSGVNGGAFGSAFFGSFTGTINTGWQNTFLGANAGRFNESGSGNVFTGFQAGQKNTTGSNNVFSGYFAGDANTEGGQNTFIGSRSGQKNTTGSKNTFLGSIAGPNNTSGEKNTFIGYGAGHNKTEANNNVSIGFYANRYGSDGNNSVVLGYYAGYRNEGNHNTYLGSNAGYNTTTGSYNVFIGNKAGYNELGSYKLYVDVTNTSDPLIYGDFNSNQVGINTGDVPSGYALAVKGKTITEEVKVRTHANWPDYVFEEDYNLSPLSTLENDIKTLGHLPGVPSAEVVAENGFHLGEMDATLLEKVEELTLYLIQMNKEMKSMNSDIQKLEAENQQLKTQLKTISNK